MRRQNVSSVPPESLHEQISDHMQLKFRVEFSLKSEIFHVAHVFLAGHLSRRFYYALNTLYDWNTLEYTLATQLAAQNPVYTDRETPGNLNLNELRSSFCK